MIKAEHRTAPRFNRVGKTSFGVYHRSKGWLVDTGVGGTFSWDVDQAGWWDTEHHAITELVECDLIPRPGPTTKLTEEILRTRTPFAIVRLK